MDFELDLDLHNGIMRRLHPSPHAPTI